MQPTSFHTFDPDQSDAVKTFTQQGWLGPFPLLTPQECTALLQRAKAVQHNVLPVEAMQPTAGHANFQQRTWFKSLHALDPMFLAIASHPAIVEKITPLLGADLLAWGVSIKCVKAGEGHRWHVDVEQTQCCGVTVFLGLRHVSPQSTLKVLSGSHRLASTPQALGLASDDAVLTYGKRQLADCHIETVNTGDGGFMVMDGRLWHGSSNTSLFNRDALILQYCKPDQQARIPLTFDNPVVWSDELPVCALVAGRDVFGINRMIPSATCLG